MDLSKYSKSKNLTNTVIILSCIGVLVYANLPLQNPIENNEILQIILVFIALLSHHFIDSSDINEKRHDDIKSTINKQYPYIPFAKEVKGSDFDFVKMANKATKSIFIVGPNLNFIANEKEKEIKKLIFNRMKENQKFKVQMLLSNPKYKQICEEMSKSTFTDSFVEELESATINLTKWKNEIKDDLLESQLSIRVTSIITLSLLFIDAEEPNAFLLVTPIPVNVKGSARPCFLIEKKQHEEAFNKYHNAYCELFKKSKDVELLC